MKCVFGAIAALLVAVTAGAQAPSADWRTITTPHFRVHYPYEYEAWSVRAASRLESIRAAVTREVGYAPPQIIDVIVSNPAAQPNGIAWPLLDTPRILLFAEPPGPEELIGAYGSWIDLVAVHEVTHVVHMLRPSRNPLQRLSETLLLPLNPITLSAPRWVLEGYATVIEGRLTGAGRPSSTVRAAILRKWAASGRLPSYDQLDSDSRFLGMSMAYLVGSAYLEWLERRSGPESMRNLWSRMTARHRRSFNEAFAGVFGDGPKRLYGQFAAELVASAIAVNRSTELREGELWQETSYATGDPVVSPDGSKIAVVIRPRNKPAKLVVWSTAPPDEEERKYAERIDRIIARDPEDVRPIRAKPLPRKPLHSFTPRDGGDIGTPRWMPDGKAILFSHKQPDNEGFLHHDLFRWTPESGDSARVTHLADVRDADPQRDGKTAVAVRSRFGLSQLVSVDLASGVVTALNDPSLETVISHPRVNRTGDVVYVANRNGRWALERLGGGTLIADGVSSPEWSRTSAEEVFATISTRGFAEIHRIRPDGSHIPLTRSSGAAFDPAPSPDGRVFFMSLEPDGLVVRVTTADALAPAQPPFDPAFVPALPPDPPAAQPFASAAVPEERTYGIGRQELASLIGHTYGPKQNATEIGLRIGDVIGRLDTIVVGSLGRRDSPRGGAIASAWRGWPVAVSAHLFRAEERRVDRNGIELRGSWSSIWPRTRLTLDAGALAGKPFDLGFVDARIAMRQIAGTWRLDEAVLISGEAGSFDHVRGVARFSVRSGATRLGFEYQRDSIADGVLEVGGLPSSIVPDSAYGNRVFQPALAAATITGTRYTGRRVEAEIPGLPLTLFVQDHRTELDRRRLAGVEVTMRTDPVPVLRLAGLNITAGAAREIGDVLERDVKWWFGLRWRP
jgi:hypothetical protein